MPYRKEQFANNGIYHVILRGLDDNLIFKDVNDYYRGIFSIYEFNNSIPITIQARRKIRATFKNRIKKQDKGSSSIPAEIMERDERDRFVDVIAFCFMPNHIHLLLKQIKDEGIIKFMRKVGTGYAGYFNRKNDRKGYVFQNRFRSVPIEDDRQFLTIFNYIHANPISLVEPGWKEKGIKNPGEVNKFLEGYKWSSYQDYIGIKNFSSVTEREHMSETVGGIDRCRVVIKSWIEYKSNLKQQEAILLE